MIIYICSPLRGDIEGNLERAKKYCRDVAELGHVPIAPHLYFTQFLDDHIPEERERGMEMGLSLIYLCEQLWVYGDVISEGMKQELKKARTSGIRVLYK